MGNDPAGVAFQESWADKGDVQVRSELCYRSNPGDRAPFQPEAGTRRLLPVHGGGGDTVNSAGGTGEKGRERQISMIKMQCCKTNEGLPRRH